MYQFWYFLDENGRVCQYYATEKPDVPEGWTEISSPPDPDPDPVPVSIPSPTIYAVALLVISPGSVGGIGVNSRFSAAIYADVGLYYVFFAETQPDTNYLAKGYDDVARVSVIEKTTDYIVVQALDSNGDHVDPAEISVEVIRLS